MTLNINELSVQLASRTVVQDVSFAVERDHDTAILGANGAGKSELVFGTQPKMLDNSYIGTS